MNTSAGKVALVTGGSRGIGAAIAIRLAQDGADVAFTYNQSPDRAAEVVEQIKAAGRRALAIQADSASVEAVQGAGPRPSRSSDGSTSWSTTRAWRRSRPSRTCPWRTSTTSSR